MYDYQNIESVPASRNIHNFLRFRKSVGMVGNLIFASRNIHNFQRFRDPTYVFPDEDSYKTIIM